MASVRRTLSSPRPGVPMNGEGTQSPTDTQIYSPHANILGSLDYALYKAQSSMVTLLSHRSSRSKLRRRSAVLHFFMCFMVGIFVGFTPFVPLTTGLLPANTEFSGDQRNERVLLNDSLSSVPQKREVEMNDGLDTATDLVLNKLLIVVTPTQARPLQAYYLQRLAHTLKLVPDPLMWIVVEMNSQTAETAEILRKTGLVYRHLVCSIKNSSEIRDRYVVLRNAALKHIETHRLDGIVYFADEDKIYSTDLFHHMRNISRVGTWTVAKLVESEGKMVIEGPICNGSQVIGWHVEGMAKRYRRFHAALSGFAFNSTIIWDPKRWRRPTIEPIRQPETGKHDMQASAVIEQLVEDESQMECYGMNSPGIMVWHHTMDPPRFPALRLVFW